MKRTMTWVAIGFIILGVIFGGVMAFAIFTGWSFNFGFGEGVATLANRQTFTAAEFEKLEIIYRSDDVTFEVTSGDEFILEEYMTNPSADKYARINESGSTLRIEQGDRSSDWFMFYNVHSAKIYIPADWHGDFDAQCSSGSLRTEENWRFNSIRLQANSGSLRFQDLTSGGGLSMTVTSGSVSAWALEANSDITLQANSGSVKVGEARTPGGITATTTSGSLKFDLADAHGVKMQANSGSIRVGSITGEFDLATTSGSIHVDNGQGHGQAVASSGSVKIALDEITGDLYMETTSGSVKLNMPKGYSFGFEAQTNSGSINTSFKDQLAYNDKGNHATGTIGGDEPQFDITCKASSGSIKVEY